jgi:hypothetical protein
MEGYIRPDPFKIMIEAYSSLKSAEQFLTFPIYASFGIKIRFFFEGVAPLGPLLKMSYPKKKFPRIKVASC